MRPWSADGTPLQSSEVSRPSISLSFCQLENPSCVIFRRLLAHGASHPSKLLLQFLDLWNGRAIHVLTYNPL